MSRVAATLARLAKIDPEPDANTHPRPAGSLADVFNLYDPQTSVPLPRRLDVLDGLRRRSPAEAWRLLRAILPTRLTIFTVVPSAVEIMGSGPARDLSVDLFGHRPRLPGIAPLDHSRYDAALRSACQEAACAVLDSEGITGLLTVAASASASVTPPPPRRKAEVVTVIEHGRQAKALEALGFRVLVGQQTRWFKASDFIVYRAKGGSFKLEYAPYGKATGMYLMAGPRGSSWSVVTRWRPPCGKA
ncbi:MAG: hypothetical protein ACLP8X_11110 [Streptosporangiaceae bacterium]